MASSLLKKAGAADHGAALLVRRPEDEATYTSVADGASAHGARLQGHEQRQAGQAIVAAGRRRRAQGQDFRVSCRIAIADRSVGRPRDNLAGNRIDDYRADRRFATQGGALRLFKGDAHGGEVMVGHSQHPRRQLSAGQEALAPQSERIAKVLARAGVASRREIERLIEAGRVALNGQLLTTPAVKVASGDILTVDGAVVGDAEPTRLFRYHKPPGLVTTHKDPKGRRTVFEALPPGLPRLISIGRLDITSEGLLLLTNDGGLARALELPSSGWVRRYRARARGRIDQARLNGLRQGTTVEGVHYGPIEATLDGAREGPSGANLWITLTLAEGKNREVRRVLESLGLTVNRLIRVAYGPFALALLEQGAVEEVGPRVIREQLSGVIAPRNLPKGERAQFVPVLSAGSSGPERVKPRGSRIAFTPAAAKERPAYKTGWAKPKKRLKGPGSPPVAGRTVAPHGRKTSSSPRRNFAVRPKGPPPRGGPAQRG